MSGYHHFSRFYDLLQKENVNYKAVSEYVDGLFLKYKSDKGILLDLACGTGGLSTALSDLGYDVIGVDGSAEMLNFAAGKGNTDIQYLCQDMKNLDLYGTVDYCVCTLDSINHITKSHDVQLVFDKISLFMNSGGLFFFDINTMHKHKDILGYNSFVYDLPKVYCIWQNHYLGKGLTNICLDFFEEADTGSYRRYSESFFEKAYPLSDIEKMLTKSGFEILNCFDWISNKPGSEKSEKINYLVRKI
ncbi:MAG: class I SAM-dependent methyltransferase [Eubacterium sp.]|jgi:SAM-dependent methyltransferase|nr:class I SAM-dependent methyltransferase [Eubacterium sp.]